MTRSPGRSLKEGGPVHCRFPVLAVVLVAVVVLSFQDYHFDCFPEKGLYFAVEDGQEIGLQSRSH